MISDRMRQITRTLITTLWLLLLIVSFAALGKDAYRNQDSFFKLTGIDSDTLLLISLVVTFIIRILHLARLPDIVTRFLSTCVLFPGLFIGVSLTVLDAVTYPNFVFGHTNLNYQQISYTAILSGWIIFWHTSTAWRKKHEAMLFFFSGLVMISLAAIISLWPFDVFIKLSEEDRFIENAQAIALMVGGFFALRIAKRFMNLSHILPAVIFGLAAVGLVAVAGDEISWGQRLFNLTPPEYFQANNVQKEITVHNLTSVQRLVSYMYLLVGLWGSGSGFLVTRIKRELPKIVLFFVSPWYLFPYFFVSFLFNFRISLGTHTIGTWSEAIELMLYLGVCFYMLQTYRHFTELLKLSKLR